MNDIFNVSMKSRMVVAASIINKRKSRKNYVEDVASRTIAIWPDGHWVDKEELPYYGWKSGDYKLIEVSPDLEDDEISELISMGEIKY